MRGLDPCNLLKRAHNRFRAEREILLEALLELRLGPGLAGKKNIGFLHKRQLRFRHPGELQAADQPRGCRYGLQRLGRDEAVGLCERT